MGRLALRRDRKHAGMQTLLLLACFCAAAIASDIDLAEWVTADWRVTTDVVMGGKSSGTVQLLAGGNEGLLFSGNINLDGGGFSSIRRTFSAKDLSAYAGVWVEVDTIVTGGSRVPMAAPQGITFQLNREKAAAFAVPVSLASGRASVFLPFSDFRHVIYRGSNGPLDTSRITSLDIYVLYQPGPFSVTLRRIVAIKNSDTSMNGAGVVPRVPAGTGDVPSMDLSDSQVESLIESTIRRGSLAYNQEQIEMCGAIYESAMLSIRAASGPKAEVKEVARTALAGAKLRQYNFNWGGQPAWIYRKGFDAIISFYDGKSLPLDRNYPQYATGEWAAQALACAKENNCGTRSEQQMTSSFAPPPPSTAPTPSSSPASSPSASSSSASSSGAAANENKNDGQGNGASVYFLSPGILAGIIIVILCGGSILLRRHLSRRASANNSPLVASAAPVTGIVFATELDRLGGRGGGGGYLTGLDPYTGLPMQNVPPGAQGGGGYVQGGGGYVQGGGGYVQGVPMPGLSNSSTGVSNSSVEVSNSTAPAATAPAAPTHDATYGAPPARRRSVDLDPNVPPGAQGGGGYVQGGGGYVQLASSLPLNLID
jgi:NADH dehydrogenase [ubiquinone] 1 alpha subcomplex assembly factor 1